MNDIKRHTENAMTTIVNAKKDISEAHTQVAEASEERTEEAREYAVYDWSRRQRLLN